MKIKILQTLVLAFMCFAVTAVAQQIGNGISSKTASSKQSILKVYPNPTNSTFSLTNDQDVKYITLFNIVGKEIGKFTHDQNKLHDIADYINGIYIVRLYDENKDVIKVLRLHKK